VQQRPSARADDDDVEMLINNGRWSEAERKPYNNCWSRGVIAIIFHSVDKNPDFKKLDAEFSELKQHGYDLQAKGVDLVKFAESGSSNVAIYSSLYSASVGLAKEDKAFQQKLTHFAASGCSATQTLAKANESLRHTHISLDALIGQPLAGITFSNIAAREVAQHAITIAPKEQKEVFAGLSQKCLSMPFNIDELDTMLHRFRDDLPRRRAGVWDAFHSVSADAIAQASHSMRDILATIIAKEADNKTIDQCAWYAERKIEQPQTKPNISDRIRFLLFGPSNQKIDKVELGIATQAVSEYVDDDGALKKTAHGSNEFTRNQIKQSMEKIEELLYLVLRRMEERKRG